MIRLTITCDTCDRSLTTAFQRLAEIRKPLGWEDWSGRQTCPECLHGQKQAGPDSDWGC